MIKKIRYFREMYRALGLSGMLSAIKTEVTGRKILFDVKRQDCKHLIHLRIPSSDASTYEQVFVNNEYNFVALTQPRVIVDAGANIGLAAIYFANKYPDAKIIAIEPERSNFEILKLNTSAYLNIVPVNAALWSDNEEINLIDPGLGEWGFMTESKDSVEKIPGNNCHVVSAMTVDKIIADYQLDRIDILKIDIEGAEQEVFADTSQWIELVDSIIIELHERMKPGCNRSFYSGSKGFDNEWMLGENVFLSRKNCLTKPDSL